MLLAVNLVDAFRPLVGADLSPGVKLVRSGIQGLGRIVVAPTGKIPPVEMDLMDNWRIVTLVSLEYDDL